MEMMMGISLTLMRQSMATAQTMNPMSLISVTPGLTFLMTSDAASCHIHNVLEFLFKYLT